MSPINFSKKSCFQTFSFRKRDRISTQKDGKKITLHSAGDINIRKQPVIVPYSSERVPVTSESRRFMRAKVKSLTYNQVVAHFHQRQHQHEQRMLRDQASATLRRQGILNTQPSNLQ